MPGLGRVWLAAATFCLAVSGVVLATEGSAQPAVGETVLAPTAAAVGMCDLAGPYVAPEQGSVGLPPGLELCTRAVGGAAVDGPLLVTEPGTVLDGWDIRGGVVVEAPDVVVRRSRITGDGSTDYGVVTTGAGSLRIEDSTLTGRFREAALGGDRVNAERLEIVGVNGDGVHAGTGARLRHSVLSRFEAGSSGDDAVDGIEVRAADVVVERVEVTMGPEHRSAILVQPAPGSRDDQPIIVRSAVLGGGDWTLLQPDSAVAPVEISDNRFARDSASGPVRVPSATAATDNTFVDGAPVPGA